MKKKILIVSSSFYPVNSPRSFRTTELVKEFARKGHIVTLITQKKNKEHTIFEKEFGIRIKDLGKQRFKGINLNKGNKFSFFFKRGISKFLDIFLYYPYIEWMFKTRNALKKENNYDLLITIAFPHSIHWGAALVQKKNNSIAKTWIADCGDPFMGAMSGKLKPAFYFKFIEKYWCRKSDFIAVPFEGAMDAYYKEFYHKIKVIPQGFNFDEFSVKNENYEKKSIPTFAYTGGFIKNVRDPVIFFEYLTNLKINYKFIIYTRDISKISSFINLSKGRIEVRNYISRKDLIQVLSSMDFIINFNNSVSNQLPSKLMDYYLAKRPVLSIDSNGFDKKVFHQFLKGDYSNQYKFINPDKYKIENVCQQFLNLV